MKNTEVEYMYRDGSNYKFHGSFIIEGELKKDDIKEYLHDFEFFVPHEIGLQHLLNLPMNQDDHYLHTFESFKETKEVKFVCTAKEFIRKMKHASENGWFSTFDYFWQKAL